METRIYRKYIMYIYIYIYIYIREDQDFKEQKKSAHKYLIG